jgi:acyl-CoA thioester hydrolase|tara:strand:+ start:475 stop:954 length:480 start_codon:yes stop_codon:yes gene_type:complete
MFLKEFEIRWSDLDANRHLANVSYITYAGEARLAFLLSLGLNNKKLSEMMIGPVVFNEQFFYFKEAFLGQKIRVSTALAGLSKEGTFFEFEHNFYNEKGTNISRCEMIGGWLNLNSRKLTSLPLDLINQFEASFKTANYKVITSKDTRKWNKIPKDLIQ